MSYSEIYTFDPVGYAHFYGEVYNANAGVMAIWRILEKKYLPSVEDPYWQHIAGEGEYVSRILISMCRAESNAIREVYNLVNDSRLTDDERIVLQTTFDRTLVKKEHLERVIKAFENFEGTTNLKEQVPILYEILADPNIIAVGFSISLTDGWTDRGLPDPEDEGSRLSYNIYTQKEHRFLFEDI